MSTLNEEGVMHVKQVACDRLLSSRVENKLQVSHCCFDLADLHMPGFLLLQHTSTILVSYCSHATVLTLRDILKLTTCLQ